MRGVDVSWEEIGRIRYACPCKKGEYEVVTSASDWGRTNESVTMLCPECNESYPYVITGFHKADAIYKWVPIAVLEAAAKERKERVARARRTVSRFGGKSSAA